MNLEPILNKLSKYQRNTQSVAKLLKEIPPPSEKNLKKLIRYTNLLRKWGKVFQIDFETMIKTIMKNEIGKLKGRTYPLRYWSEKLKNEKQ